MSHSVFVGAGRVLVPSDTYQCYLPGVDSAALVEREGRVLLLPLRGPVAGGMLLKQRNLRGDRVLLATDFLAQRGIGPFEPETEFPVRWVADAGALEIQGLGITTNALSRISGRGRG